MRKIEEARPIYERLVEQFPSAGKYWKIYIEQEVNILFFIPHLALSFMLLLKLDLEEIEVKSKQKFKSLDLEFSMKILFNV